MDPGFPARPTLGGACLSCRHRPGVPEVAGSRVWERVRAAEGDVGVQAFLQQLPALVGVMIGALATWAATSAAERAKWRRGQSVRWDEKKLAAYTEYSYAVKQLISAATRLKDQREDHGDGTVSADVQAVIAAGEAALAAAEDERTMKWESVLLLAKASRGDHRSTGMASKCVPPGWMALGRESDMAWDEAVEAVSQARRVLRGCEGRPGHRHRQRAGSLRVAVGKADQGKDPDKKPVWPVISLQRHAATKVGMPLTEHELRHDR